jgi:uncharacterized protein (TIGR02453 family)
MRPPFAGFPEAGFDFLRGLAATQDRAWFEAQRATYEEALRAPMESLVLEVAEVLAQRRIPLGGDPRKAVFRIHRDVRFSKDKSPYKTHVGAVLARAGKKPGSGVLYIHIDPEGCFAACGFYQPEPAALEAIRGAIAAKPAAYKRMLAGLAAKGLALAEDETALKRPPRGFDGVTDPVALDSLRRRSFVVQRALGRAQVAQPALVTEVAGFAEAAAPLLRFGWAATGA